MKKIFDGFVEKSETLLNVLGIGAILLVLGIRFFLLDKGLIPSDDKQFVGDSYQFPD